MKSLHVYRAVHLLPFVNLLKGSGAPVEMGLRKCKLPTMLEERLDAALPLIPTLDFLSVMALKEGISEMGLRAAQGITLSDFNVRTVNAVLDSPTLHAGLQRFFELAPVLEDTSLEFRLSYGPTECRITCTESVPSNFPGLRHSEWGNILSMIAVLRAFAGLSWRPSEIAFATSAPLSSYASEAFPNTRMLVGQDAAWITVPRDLLRRRAPSQQSRRANVGLKINDELIGDPPSVLRHVLAAYLSEGCPTIEFAAELASVSVRTLQRKLRTYDLTYSELIQHARFDLAANLLRNTDAKMLEVAYECGYDDPSHFSRAFRRVSGLSPREFRVSKTALAEAS